ncbi:MAG: hypothetical protein A2V92_05430 [Candidatus Muproteobacteria bacterium RBG_16_65_31]|uniref:Uncharacterized protein n=1 Tax=Candidatus Muproteobacteria bacterium RBG_16_65_31 TaxID=1817759 RepID=A0A1F6TGK0_9PROT|nr:MAG: hypothetical protein A2V92_05430 [Candidatus Muproteobacteria bacterium RBG_16_65_31]
MRARAREPGGGAPASGAVTPRLALVAVLLALGGCAGYSDSFDPIAASLAEQRYDRALEALERRPPARRDQVLYLLDRGMLLRMNRDFAGSNQALEAAQARIAELYGKSVSEESLAFVINDATRSYVGEEHEQVLMHLYKALNYLDLGARDEARVEALQVDVRLREFGEKVGYAEDAFARYLTGIIYEERGEWSDAMIAYRKAYEAYRKHRADYAVDIPQFLKQDLLRLASRQGLRQELARYQKEFALDRWMSLDELRAQGELIFILHAGLAPIKREHAVTLPDPQSGHLVRISLPYYESRPADVARARLTVGGAEVATALVEDVEAIARKSLAAKMPAISARAAARAVVKSQLARAAREGGRGGGDRDNALAAIVLGLGVEVASLLTERADTRGWLTLPHDIQLARLPLPPGSHKIKVDLLDRNDQVVAVREYADVVIRRGQKTFISQHWISPRPYTWRTP